MSFDYIKLHSSTRGSIPAQEHHPLFPTFLRTPSGLALLELQGTFNLPYAAEFADTSADPSADPSKCQPVPVGRLEFPEYKSGTDDSSWMKHVHMYVGQHQRLTGEVKKLPRAVAVVRRRNLPGGAQGDNVSEDLEVAELIKYKLVFSQRPEPVGTEQLLT